VAIAKIWFVLIDGQVTGPYEPDEVDELISKSKEIQIWGKGYAEWMEPIRWRQSLKENLQNNPPPKAPESTKMWRSRVEGREQSPMLYTDMIKFLKTLKDFSSVDIFIDKLGQWREIYALQQIADDLGISRRSHPRVPILGTLECESESKGHFNCRVISISEGGLGVTDVRNLQIGDRFTGTLNSPNLFMQINAICDVVYVGNDGYAGLRFANLPIEAKSSIIEYVNKFASANI
jgi:PilZ domain.